jgi:S1-C subfamily serine protease
MARIEVLLVVLASTSLVSAQEKDKPQPKPAMVGIMLAKVDNKGAFEVRMVLDNSPAEKAGLKSGDILVRINGIKPANLATAVRVIRALKPGKKVKFLIEREGKEKTIEIVPVAASE